MPVQVLNQIDSIRGDMSRSMWLQQTALERIGQMNVKKLHGDRLPAHDPTTAAATAEDEHGDCADG